MKTLLKIFFLSILTSAAHGVNYYVNNNGNDLNPGTEARPWATIDKVEQSARSGDHVFLRRGSKWITQFNLPSSNMVIDAYGDGPPPIIDGSSLYFSIAAVGKSHITIRNLKLVNAANDCIRIEEKGETAQDILIENNTITGCKRNGINFTPSDADITAGRLPHNIRVLNNAISNCGNAAVLIRAQANMGDNRVAHNVIDNVGISHPTNAISLHYVHNIIIEFNTITNTRSTKVDGSGITADNLKVDGKDIYGSGAIIRHNSVECPSPPVNDEQAGIAVWYQPNVEIHHNTVLNCNDGIRISGEPSTGYNVHHNRIVGARKNGAAFKSHAPKGEFKYNTLSGINDGDVGIFVNTGSQHPDAAYNEVLNFRTHTQNRNK